MDDATRPEGEPDVPGTSRALPAWSRLHLWQIQWVRDVLIVLLIVGLFWLGQKISIVTVPLLLALMFAYLFEPVIQWLMRRTRLKRQGAVGSIILGVVVLVLVPSALGATFGAFQAVGLLTTIAERTGTVWKSVQSGRAVASLDDQINERRARLARGKEIMEQEGAAPPEAEAPAEAPEEGREPGKQPAQEESFVSRIFGIEESLPTPRTPEEIAALEAEIAQLEQQREAAVIVEQKDLEPLEGLRNWTFIRNALVEQRDEGSIDEGFQSLQQWLRANAEQIAGTAATAGANIIHTTLRFFMGAFGLVFMIFLTAFFFFFVSTGWVQVKDFGMKLLPERNRDLVLHLLREFDRVISAFIRGRLTIAFLQSIVFTLGYFIIGVPAAFILGPIVAVLSIVPYLALISVPISIILLGVEGHAGFRGHWLWIIGAPTVFYFIAQALDDYVWTPWIQGKSTDMSTPMILFASLAGGVLFGVFGLLIAIPIAACVKILLQEVFWPHFKRWTEGDEEDFLPIARERRRT